MKKILVANRGEIALRVMRSIKEMGIATVAVYSDADRTAPHVRYADEAVHLGYGFLSENATFAKLVEDAGIRFIGPSPHAIEIMGSKLAAKQAVSKYDTPLVPGTEEAIENPEEAMKIAREIGFPILIKASAGGGGKGMRIVEKEEELEEQMSRAISEAVSAFGDGAVFIEKYVGSPRHIEIQILADSHDNILYLHERECSVQRRHQKVIEEAPSMVVSPEMRKAMGKAAVDVARACNYVGAGTVEFLVDEKLNFYFLEMNTRLQVEHPVTELITGIDLVKEQVRIARGEKLPYKQEDIQLNGHALELRVYAEDPANNFLPDIGTLEVYRKPEGPGIRVDDGYTEGMTIPINYDPMIAKLVTYGNDRSEALDRMLRAIEEYQIVGIKTTLDFGRFVCQHPNFISGEFDTHFVKNYFNPDSLKDERDDEAALAAELSAWLMDNKKKSRKSKAVEADKNSPWKKRAGL
jgi:propionyl-CoA carboxylase alpha chain